MTSPDAGYPLDWSAPARIRRRVRRSRPGRAAGRAADLLLEARQRALGIGRELDRAAAEAPIRDVLVLGLYGAGAGEMAAAVRRLRESHQSTRIVLGALGEPAPELESETALAGMEGGKFANLNRLAEAAGPLASDWVLLLDDDVILGRNFLDRLVVLAERFRLSLAQPALSRASFGWWNVNRRRPALLRETRFVEIGPAVLISREAYRHLAPFPDEGMGWGLDLHWAALAEQLGWRLGVADAVPVRHESRPTASAVDSGASRIAAERLLDSRPHVTHVEAEEVVARHTRLQ